MHEFHGRASARIDAPPAAVFDLITDVDRLPDWNAAIEALVDKPPALVPGAEWTVTVNPPGIRPGAASPGSRRSTGKTIALPTKHATPTATRRT